MRASYPQLNEQQQPACEQEVFWRIDHQTVSKRDFPIETADGEDASSIIHLISETDQHILPRKFPEESTHSIELLYTKALVKLVATSLSLLSRSLLSAPSRSIWARRSDSFDRRWAKKSASH